MLQQTLVDNRYSILNLLGSGGMGHVYLARDEVLGRDVALKVLKEPYTDDEEFVERFRREARNAAALSHPNIVPVYDGGKAEDGTPYIAMEYMAGGTLGESIEREGRLDAREAAAIAIQIAQALREAHRRGVVHRDVKPHNIFLAEYPASSSAAPDGISSGAVKVGDFGIARATEATTMTDSSLMLGTPRYLSPEQAKGEPVGPRSDLYSLGVVLYQMLTGRVPFDDEDPIAITIKHVSEPPPSPKETNPGIPEEMNALVLRLLSKDPEDRHGDAAELIRDLKEVRRRFSTALLGVKPPEVPANSEETKGAAPPVLGKQDGTLQGTWKKRAGIPSAAVVYNRDQKRRRISLWLVVVASVAILAILLGTVGQNLLQDYATQASVTGPQDAAKEPVDTPSETPKETQPAAAGEGSSAAEKETKPSPAGSPSQGKASSYTVSPVETTKQSSGPKGTIAIPANLVTQGSAPPAPPELAAPPASPPTPEAESARSSSAQSSQHLVVTAKNQNTIKSGEPSTKTKIVR